MANETINSRAAAMEPSLDTGVVDYVHAVFEQVNRNQKDWGIQNAQVIAKLQEKVAILEAEVANLKGRL
jgi:cell division protein FtsB